MFNQAMQLVNIQTRKHHSRTLAYLYFVVSEEHICLEKLNCLVDNIKIRVYNQQTEHW